MGSLGAVCCVDAEHSLGKPCDQETKADDEKSSRRLRRAEKCIVLNENKPDLETKADEEKSSLGAVCCVDAEHSLRKPCDQERKEKSSLGAVCCVDAEHSLRKPCDQEREEKSSLGAVCCVD